MTNFTTLCEILTKEIQDSYEEGVTMEQAEKLAGKFLFAQIQVSAELTKADLDARMRKSGTKAVKASVYLAAVQATEKKPSDTLLNNLVDTDKLVLDEQASLDASEVLKGELERYYSIFQQAHHHFKAIARGRFE